MLVNDAFRPGIYRHYKGGLYIALGLGRHHELDHQEVRYISIETGSESHRPLFGVPTDPDGFVDLVQTDKGFVRRFTYLGQPNDRPLKERFPFPLADHHVVKDADAVDEVPAGEGDLVENGQPESEPEHCAPGCDLAPPAPSPPYDFGDEQHADRPLRGKS